MSLIKISEPEWCTNNSYHKEDIIVRRILITSERTSNDCILNNIPASARYPSPEFEFTAKCEIMYPPTIYTIMVKLYLPRKVTEELISALGDDILINKRNSSGSIVIEVPIRREHLVWNTALEYHHQVHPENLGGDMVKIKDVFELSCIFNKCNKTNDYTCFNDEHSKSWELRIKSNRPSIVGYKRGGGWI